MVEKRESVTKQLYIIGQSRFMDESSLQVVPQPYKFGEKVTRMNFTNFLVSSFAHSQGTQIGLWSQLEWLRINRHFDYQNTLTSFVDAGGFDRLSLQEQTLLKNEARNVKTPGHAGLDKSMGIDLPRAILDVLDPKKEEAFRETFPEEQLQKLSASEFQRQLRRYLHEHAPYD